MPTTADRERWGVILAGGDGVRLRPLTRFISGDERPKQFCPLYGGLTLLEHARQRAARCVPDENILFSLTRSHENFYRRILADCPSQRVVQPGNRGTAPAILSALLLIAQRDPNAYTAVFPSDHYYSSEDAFSEAMERAFELAHREQDCVVLLGAKPHGPEVEYGWIEVGDAAAGRPDAFRVRSFHEKPAAEMAQFLFAGESLWNTFVMVGNTLAFLEMICSALPGLLTSFRKSLLRVVQDREIQIEDALYERIASSDFSRQVLSMETGRLIAQRLDGTGWSDLRDCERAAAALSRVGAEPEWATNWRAARRPMARPVVAASAVA